MANPEVNNVVVASGSRQNTGLYGSKSPCTITDVLAMNEALLTVEIAEQLDNLLPWLSLITEALAPQTLSLAFLHISLISVLVYSSSSGVRFSWVFVKNLSR